MMITMNEKGYVRREHLEDARRHTLSVAFLRQAFSHCIGERREN